MARFCDPLGLYFAVSVVAKLLFQDTWCRGIDWNELLPRDLGVWWHACVSTLTSLLQLHIPRWLATSEGNFQVHIFCDASERACGPALYIRSTRDYKTLNCLACGKNRPAPVKRITLPYGAFNGSGGEMAVALLLPSDRLRYQSGGSMVRHHCDLGFDKQWSKQMEELCLQ